MKIFFKYFEYDFYHEFLSGTLLVYSRRMKTGVNLQHLVTLTERNEGETMTLY